MDWLNVSHPCQSAATFGRSGSQAAWQVGAARARGLRAPGVCAGIVGVGARGLVDAGAPPLALAPATWPSSRAFDRLNIL